MSDLQDFEPDDMNREDFEVGVHCPGCGKDITIQECDCDDYCEGRHIASVCEYASTCDWCYQLASHEGMAMDLRTQLGYCEDCMQILEVAAMVEAGKRVCPYGQPLELELDKNGNNKWLAVYPVEPIDFENAKNRPPDE